MKDQRFESLRRGLQRMAQCVRARKDGKLRIGTICSGLGVQEMVSEAFEKLWNELFPELSITATRCGKKKNV